MNATGAPWRLLEEQAEGAGGPDQDRAKPAGDPPKPLDGESTGGVFTLPGLRPRQAAVLGGFGLAAGLAALALVVEVAPTGGSVHLDPDGLPSADQGSLQPGDTGGSSAGTSGSAATASEISGPGMSTVAAAGGQIVVDVGGAVLRPGVYHLATSARVADAIAAAGGYGPRLDAARASIELNLAARLSDGEQVRVPSRDDPSRPPASGEPAQASPKAGDHTSAPGGLVNINSASSSELDALPGIGPVTAAKIIAAREEQPFTSLDELTSRKVMGRATLDKLRASLTVR